MGRQHNKLAAFWRQATERYLPTALEERQLLACALGSALVHLWILASSWERPPHRPPPMEWAIEADIGASLPTPAAVATLSESEQKAASKQLPQLPKRFAATDDTHGSASTPDPTPSPTPSPKDEAATRLFKKQLLQRLQAEQERQQKIQAKAKKAAPAKKDGRVEKMLAQRQAEIKSGRGAGIKADHPYIQQLQAQIAAAYRMPGVYHVHHGKKPVLFLELAADGIIKDLAVEQSSDNDAVDHLAMQTVRAAAPFPEPPVELHGQAIHLVFDPQVF